MSSPIRLKKPVWWRWRWVWILCLVAGPVLGYVFGIYRTLLFSQITTCLNSDIATGFGVGLTAMVVFTKMSSRHKTTALLDEDFVDRILEALVSSLFLVCLAIVKESFLFWIKPTAISYPFSPSYIYGIGLLALTYSIKAISSSVKWILEKDQSYLPNDSKIPGIEGVNEPERKPS